MPWLLQNFRTMTVTQKLITLFKIRERERERETWFQLSEYY